MFPLIFRRTRLVTGSVALFALVAIAVGLGARPSAESSAQPRTDDGPWRRMALPPGEYASLVFGNGGNNSSVIADFQTPAGTFPLVIGPSQTVQIEFRPALQVGRSDTYVLDATPGRFTLKSEVIRSGFVSVFGTGPGGVIPLTPIR